MVDYQEKAIAAEVAEAAALANKTSRESMLSFIHYLTPASTWDRSKVSGDAADG